MTACHVWKLAQAKEIQAGCENFRLHLQSEIPLSRQSQMRLLRKRADVRIGVPSPATER